MLKFRNKKQLVKERPYLSMGISSRVKIDGIRKNSNAARMIFSYSDFRKAKGDSNLRMNTRMTRMGKLAGGISNIQYPISNKITNFKIQINNWAFRFLIFIRNCKLGIRNFLNPFYFKKLTAVLVILAVIGTVYFQNIQNVQSATYAWTQTGWDVNASSGSTIVHPATGTTYESKDSKIDTASGTAVAVSPDVGTPITQTNDGSTNTGFDLSGNSKSNTELNGTVGDGSSVVLSRLESIWLTMTADNSSGNVGQHTSLQLDASDYPVASYYDATITALKVIHCNDATCSGGDESIATVDNNANVGAYSSLQLDTSGYPVISYRDNDNNVLKIVHCNDANCSGGNESIEVVDSSGNVGYGTSLQLDLAGFPVVSYQDATNGNLKVVHCNDANCSGSNENIETVDSSGNIGLYTSLQLDASKYPVVSYFDNVNSDLKVIHCNDANCSGGDESITTADNSVGNVGGYVSLQLDTSNGYPVMSYNRNSFSMYDLIVVHCNDANCSGSNESISNVDNSSGNVGPYTSLQLDASDYPVVSYYDATNTNLKIVHCNDANCSGNNENISTVDNSSGNVGYDTSLQLDVSGYPVVSYYDVTSSNLKVAAYGYYSSGTFTSGGIDTGQGNASWGNLDWTAAGTGTITMQARSCDDINCSSAGSVDESATKIFGTNCSDITDGTALSTGNCMTNGDRYIQYQASLSGDTAATPSLDEVTVGYNYYDTAAQTLISSAYNTTDSNNVPSKISWTEDIPAGTDVKFQIRTSADGAGWTAWCGPDDGVGGSCSSSTYFTDPAGGETVDDLLTDQTDDSWIQYKVFLAATTSAAPTVSDVSMEYVVNATPEFQNVTASQGSNGTVTVAYDVRDPDTSTGATPGEVSIALQYCTANCSTPGSETWATAATVSGNAGAGITAEESNWNSYSLTWTPAADYDGQYNGTDFKIRVRADDGEGANNYGYGQSPTFIMDTKDPAPSASPILIDAVASPATITLSATDDSALQMKVGLAATLIDASWEAYNATKSLALETDPDMVYAQFKDAYGNTSSIVNSASIATPAGLAIQDTSSIYDSPADYRLFLKWTVSADPAAGFKQYNIYRSADNITFASIGTVATRTINYYTDTTVSGNTSYYYKISLQDNNDNISYYSASVQGVANGAQNADEAVIYLSTPSQVVVQDTSNVAADPAQYRLFLSWQTINAPNPLTFDHYNIYRSADDATYTLLTTITDRTGSYYADNATSYNQDYYYKINAEDAIGNVSYFWVSSSSTSSFNGKANGTQDAGEGSVVITEITNITESVVTDEKAVVTFDTDQSAQCSVEYGTQVGNYTEIPVVESSYNVNHSMHITGLIFSTVYYYQITCEDRLENTLSSSEHSFTTSAQLQTSSEWGAGQGGDDTPPEISSVNTGTITGESAIIKWNTNEEGNSSVSFGITSGTYENGAVNDLVNANVDNYTKSHEVTINNLVPSTKYYYLVRSIDSSGNIGESSEKNFTTKSAANLSGVKAVSTKLGEVAITWQSSKKTTSVVEYGETETYGESKESSAMSTEHEIIISNLKQSTEYFFMVKGKDGDNNWYSSQGKFTPKSPPSISDIEIENVTEHSAKITFATNIATDALITYADISNSDNSGSQGKPELATSHEIELKNLMSGTNYVMVIKVRDEEGNETEDAAQKFTTSKDENPPQIDQVRTDSALAQGDKVQTIISWTTDEPATAALLYKEGKGGQEKEVKINNSPSSVSHVAVITVFKTGTVYYFKARSGDQSGNEALSSEYALLTPRRKENIIQVIVNNFYDIFSWTKF